MQQEKKTQKNIKALLSLSFVVFAWGSSFVSLKYLVMHCPPFSAIFLRMGLASLVFLPFVFKLKGLKIRKGDLKWLLLLSLCEPCLYFIFEANALRLTSASQAGLVASFYPVLVALGAAFFFKETITGRTLFGFFLALSGVAALSWLGRHGEENAVNPVMGNILEFIAMILAMGFALLTKKLAPHYPAMFLVLFTSLSGFIFYLPLSIYEAVTVGFALFNSLAFFSAFYLAVVVTAMGMWCFSYTLKYVSASKTASAVNLCPLVSLFLGVVLMGDEISFWQYIAALAIFGGMIMSQSKR